VLIHIRALYKGLPLHPDDEKDPYVFRLDLSKFGMSTVRIVFGREVGVGTTALHSDLGSQPLSLQKQSAHAELEVGGNRRACCRRHDARQPPAAAAGWPAVPRIAAFGRWYTGAGPQALLDQDVWH